MARHGEILDSFKQKVDNFDFANEEHVTCVSFLKAIYGINVHLQKSCDELINLSVTAKDGADKVL